MPHSVTCPACGQTSQLPEGSQPRPVACPACAAALPAEDGPAAELQSTRVVRWAEDRGDAASEVTPPPEVNTRLEPRPEGQPPGAAREQKTVILGDYRLLKKLGEGAMGIVYKARQLSLDRDVALKVLFKHVARNSRSVERFYREARIMARLEHPNIVRGYAVGEDQGWHYFAMELIHGGSLQRWLKHQGKFGVPDALHVILACARGLQYAHERDLIHRDIKPDNVLLTREGVVKLSDLGMAKMLDEEVSLTQTGFGVGTPAYMSLEQARNSKEADQRCDIYALGCLLYCLLTGQPPFTGATLVELVQAKEAGTFRAARRFNPDVPSRLDLIIHKMVAKLPQHRYQSCTEVIKDLEDLRLAAPALGFLLGPKDNKDSKDAKDMGQPGTLTPPETPGQPPSSGEVEVEDKWYVRWRNADGVLVQKKLTTAEVLELIQDKDFDLKAQASRRKRDGFRSLATYREFGSVLLPRLTRAGADQAQGQASKLRSLYEQLEEKDRAPGKPPSAERKLPPRPQQQGQQGQQPGPSRLGLALGLGAIGLGGLVVFLLLRYFMPG
jgi:serine/threonine protein kinase